MTVAALRHAIPEANPSIYFGTSLGMSLRRNILLGIPPAACCSNDDTITSIANLLTIWAT
ncbi:sodium-dependent bicarbonate transport family permease [Duganella sp.]|uniref:sodium-dependent bicarbonate transport family permease n=1 Tax=Duganella sp. TaxID=1904440 RepID=UPI0031DB632E